MEEGTGGIVAMDEIDEGIGGTERKGLAGEGGLDKAGPARAVDAAETDGGATCLQGQLLGLEQDVAGRCAAGRGCFIDLGGVVLRIDRRAAGENSKSGVEEFQKVVQGLAINPAVGFRVATIFTAQAVDEEVGAGLAGQGGAQLSGICRIRGDDAVGFAGQAPGGFFRRNKGGDLAACLVKEIRASFAGVATASEEDARSWNGLTQDGLKRCFILARLALALALRRVFWVGVSKARRRRTSSMIPSESSFDFNRLIARSIDSPLRTMTSGISDSHPF